jgi:hypothetical protein
MQPLMILLVNFAKFALKLIKLFYANVYYFAWFKMKATGTLKIKSYYLKIFCKSLVLWQKSYKSH